MDHPKHTDTADVEPTYYGVVINRCHGGFGLSLTALQWLVDREHAGAMAVWEAIDRDPDLLAINLYDNVDRDDPMLVDCVKALGAEANGEGAKLSVVVVPKGWNWDVDEHDGNEKLRMWPRSVKSSR